MICPYTPKNLNSTELEVKDFYIPLVRNLVGFIIMKRAGLEMSSVKTELSRVSGISK